MYQINRAPGRTVWANNKEFLFFSGYSYLGMGHVKDFTDAIKEGIDQFGVLHPSSRISNTQLELYNTFETILSVLTGTEQTVSFSSGYLAGRAVVDCIMQQGNPVYSAPHTHPAINSGIQLPANDWKNYLVKTINQSSTDNLTLLMDSVNPLTAAAANFSFLNEINPNKHLTLVIDDSHGIGLLGPVGDGVSHLVPRLQNLEVIITYSLSKAFHINGGAVSCSKSFAKLLCKSPYYTASTAIAPCLAYAFIKCQPLYLLQLKKLQENIAGFSELVRDFAGVTFYPNLPIFVLKTNWDQTIFDPHHIIISSFAYPNPSGVKVNRVVLNALHTKQDLFKLSSIISGLYES